MFTQSSDSAQEKGKTACSRMIALLARVCSMATNHGCERKLRLCETLSLGEKRFIAVVEYGRSKFLLAGTPEKISLLQRLDDGPEKENLDAVPELKSGLAQFSQT